MRPIRQYSGDETIISGLKDNCEKALEFLVREYSRSLCLFCDRIIKDQAQAEEIVSDVFYAVWEKRNRIHIHTSLKSYLFISVRNRALQFLRKQKRLIIANEIDPATECPLPNALDDLMFAESRRQVETLIYALPQKRKEIFVLGRIDGLATKEIADLLSISEKTVLNQLNIAAKQVKDQYALTANIA